METTIARAAGLRRYSSKKQLLIVDLYDFEIYRDPGHGKRAYELTSLHQLEVPIAKKLCFDGFVCLGDIKQYVRTVPIKDCSIEGYGDDQDPKIVAYVQSELSSRDDKYDIWYKLNRATPEYARFHEPFLWVAQFGKHVLDYMEDQPTRSVTLRSFHSDFFRWLSRRFPSDADFRKWHVAFRSRSDFRVGVNAYIDYIYHQAFNLSNSKHLLAHPLWGECMVKGATIVQQQQQEVVKNTLATPDVYASFKHMYFGSQLREKRPAESVQIEQERRKRKLGFARSGSTSPVRSPNICQPYGASRIKVGDVVAFDPDEEDLSIWRGTGYEWLAYVQATEDLENGTQRLLVLYVYRHWETNICKAQYPFENEVFLSDNCNCTEGDLLSTDVKGRYDVDWCPPTVDFKSKRFLMRQTYITQDSAFMSVQDEHKTCICRKAKVMPIDGYRPGDTVYVLRTLNREQLLDPVVIHNINRASSTVTVRRLLRLQRDCTELAQKAHRLTTAPNELVLSDEYDEVAISRVQRRCSIRFVSKSDILNDRVPFPYNRGGAGDLWYFSMGLTTVDGEQNLKFLRSLPKTFQEGSDMTLNQKLKGLSIFSGGGSLDRGLEEGGAVEFQSAVDFSPQAIHTQRANAKHPESMRLYCGSVDDFFDAALNGRNSKFVARVGEVELIAAGSPCPGMYNREAGCRRLFTDYFAGFSVLQQNFLSEQSLRNASHISTFCSFVDIYRPQYGILENVVNMASTRTGYEDQNVLSQVVACLVSMEYQVNQYIMDAWSCGSAQQRSRILLCIAAPGLAPIAQPWHTHSRPYEETIGRSLGRLPNGQRFGEREHYPTPFHYTPAATISSGLPNIGNGNVQACISYPDHRYAAPPAGRQRALLRYIPKQPPGCGYKEAYRLGLIPPSLQSNKQEVGKSYKRIKAAGLVPTITTGISMQDARNGACLHWSQDRPITILEARRVQGYADDEVIVGSLPEQYRIVGNGVDRKVALAMGLALRQAVQKNGSGFTANGITETFEEVTEVMSKAEDDSADSEGTELVIHVQVPLALKQETRKSRPSVVIPVRPKGPVSARQTILSPTPTITEGSGSDKRPDEHFSDVSPPPKSAQKPDLLSRLSRTLTNSVGRLSLSSMPLMPRPTTSSVSSKRHREEDMEPALVTEKIVACPEEHPNKRAKTDKMTQALEIHAYETESDVDMTSTRSVGRDSSSRSVGRDSLSRSVGCKSSSKTVSRESSSRSNGREGSTSSTKTRYTRHSGLSVEFAPKFWNKKPEVEMRNHDQ
jgi:DNA (cytosine-5)-methyltransferase 1